MQLQESFFQQIKNKVPAHISLVEETAELLNISTDSAYRRIRGEKKLSLEEVKILCSHFKISLDHLLSVDANSTVFFGSWIDNGEFNFEKYLTDMLFQLQVMNSSVKKEMYYEAKDIPPFHHFQFPELASFKYFFWMKTILQDPRFSKSTFDPEHLMEPLINIGKKIIETYIQIPSIEIWNVETINSSLRQINFYSESGLFSKKGLAAMLYDQLEKLILHIEKETETGTKFLFGDTPPEAQPNYQLYHNEVMLGHNTIVAITDEKKTVFINHSVLNYMITRDQKFCDSTLNSLQNIMRKSSPISIVNEKERYKFFKSLKEETGRRKSELTGQ